MSNYVDYNYYVNNYLQGREQVVPTTSFNFYSMKATTEIRNRIFDKPIIIDEDIKNCTCDLAEYFYRDDTNTLTVSKTSQNGISSESVGEYSVTYATTKSEEYSLTNREQNVKNIIDFWLGNKGYSMRRVEVVY